MVTYKILLIFIPQIPTNVVPATQWGFVEIETVMYCNTKIVKATVCIKEV